MTSVGLHNTAFIYIFAFVVTYVAK